VLNPQAISHNHYDHMDSPTLSALYKRFSSRPPLLFLPLNNTRCIPSDIPRDRVIEMDWWEGREVTVEGKGKISMTCSEWMVCLQSHSSPLSARAEFGLPGLPGFPLQNAE
jgi:L-ascorbate metabolism protein UlaG (beta-lactamase superfamily)